MANLDQGPFFFVQAYDTRTDCGANPSVQGIQGIQGIQGNFFREEVLAPRFILILLEITNVSSMPARGISFDGRKYRTSGPPLRLYNTLAPAQSDVFELETLSFPIGILQRGEHILIPLSVLAEKPNLWTTGSPSPPLTRHLTQAIDIDVGDRVEYYRSNLLESEKEFYYFGPTVRITGVNEGSSKTLVRELAMQNFTYSTVNVAGVGSCPSLSFRTTDSSWTPLRHVLIGAEGKGREREEVHELPDFGGELVLREEDNETSFLSRVAVEVTGHGGTKACLPQESAFASQAGRYFVLHRHDELQVRCSLRSGEEARLIIRGYYEPIIK
jgi:hypothetical protein